MKRKILLIITLLLTLLLASCGITSEEIDTAITGIDSAYQGGTYEQAQEDIASLEKAYNKMSDEQKTKYDALKSSVEYAVKSAETIKYGLNNAQSFIDKKMYYEAQAELDKLSASYTFPPAEQKQFDEQKSVIDTGIKEYQETVTAQAAAKPQDIYNTLDVDGTKKLNIFLSNFSESYFNEYDCNNVNADRLISFAFIHDLINNHSLIKYSNQSMGISCDRANETLSKYFGKTISKTSTSNWSCDGSYFWMPAATGESYDYFSVALNLIDLKDGTYKVDFNNYYAGYDSMDSKYYWYNNAQASNDVNCKLTGNGTAIIKSVSGNWQLLKLTTN